MLYFCNTNIYRQYHCIHRLRAFNHNRWITLDVFLGYYLEHPIFIQVGWNLFIPLASINLSLLSIEMITLYNNVINQTNNTLAIKQEQEHAQNHIQSHIQHQYPN